jgi:hypothetical protein
MSNINTELPGEDVNTHPTNAPSTPDPLNKLRQTAALNELQQLREDLQARDMRISELQHEIGAMQSQAPVAPHRTRGAMSARIGAEDQTARQRSVENAATHATATGKRRDLLSYLRLRRRRSAT